VKPTTAIPTDTEHRLTDEIVTGEVEDVLLRSLPIKTRTRNVLTWIVRTLVSMCANKESAPQVQVPEIMAPTVPETLALSGGYPHDGRTYVIESGTAPEGRSDVTYVDPSQME